MFVIGPFLADSQISDAISGTRLRQRLRQWQPPSDPSTNHNIAYSLQHVGTAEWFCDGNIFFEEWKMTGSLLWIHGKRALFLHIMAPVTDGPRLRSWLWKDRFMVSRSLILATLGNKIFPSSSAIIEKIATLYRAGKALMAYFYFDFRNEEKRSRRNLLPSLLAQLSARSEPFCDIFHRLYMEHDNGLRQPSDSALMVCLKKMLTLPCRDPVYLILDALDECPKTSGVPPIRKQVLDLVKELVDLRLPHLHICVTSRPEVDIQHILGSVASHSVSLHTESGQKKDITEYVKSVIRSNSFGEITRWSDADKELVIETLSERADGM